ncbi:MAG: TMEM165/GDT1 family protein [Woeseiaceae bacterium]|jgi:putative Ca2+/H+ antiporter (TMEM165/GDT1 family)|nr:TMEM165/GDT1 family protein [Woeseiaceae bacterium]
MDIKSFIVIFGTVFLAELGDKTQLATVLFASRPGVSLVGVFIGASLALILSSALAVGAGSVVAHYVDPRVLSYIAGAGFVVIGIWTIVQAAAL